MSNLEYYPFHSTLSGVPIREGMTADEIATDVDNIQTQLTQYNALQSVNNPTSQYNNKQLTNPLRKDPADRTLEEVIIQEQNMIIGQKDSINMLAVVTGITLIIVSIMVLKKST